MYKKKISLVCDNITSVHHGTGTKTHSDGKWVAQWHEVSQVIE